MRINRYAIFTATLLVAVALSVTSAAADQHSGTWKMNPAKSKYSPGPAAKNLALTVEADENSVKIDSQGTDGEGNPTHVQYDAKFDGKDYPVTGDPESDARSYRKIDDRTMEFLVKKGGKVMASGKIVVAPDGKSRTVTTTGMGPKGKKFHSTAVYDKA